MRVTNSIQEVRALVREARAQGKSIGLVPTMGYLHEGHLSLMRAARKKTGFVIATIFVNPLQFGAGEDYEEYPRDLTRDSELAEREGVDVIFSPTVKEMYPKGYGTFVEVEGLTDKLCGKSRPGHFRGVTTVVNKLFNIVRPDLAFFGQKDAQQVLVIKKMVQDLNMDLEIEIVGIVREEDGLAMSSRNAYLSPEERRAAVVLSRSLAAARERIASGERDVEALKQGIYGLIRQEPLARVDYVEILSVPDLGEIKELSGKSLIALAVFLGKTRLIDNALVEV